MTKVKSVAELTKEDLVNMVASNLTDIINDYLDELKEEGVLVSSGLVAYSMLLALLNMEKGDEEWPGILQDVLQESITQHKRMGMH